MFWGNEDVGWWIEEKIKWKYGEIVWKNAKNKTAGSHMDEYGEDSRVWGRKERKFKKTCNKGVQRVSVFRNPKIIKLNSSENAFINITDTSTKCVYFENFVSINYLSPQNKRSRISGGRKKESLSKTIKSKPKSITKNMPTKKLVDTKKIKKKIRSKKTLLEKGFPKKNMEPQNKIWP